MQAIMIGSSWRFAMIFDFLNVLRRVLKDFRTFQPPDLGPIISVTFTLRSRPKVEVIFGRPLRAHGTTTSTEQYFVADSQTLKTAVYLNR